MSETISDEPTSDEPITMDNAAIRLVHPGEVLRAEIVEEYGLSVEEAADVLGVDPIDLSRLLRKEAPISAEMALRFEKAFGVGMNLLLNMQVNHDLQTMRRRADEIVVERYEAA